jgi:hypothetical protein
MVTKTVEVGRDKNPMQVTGWRDSKGVVHYTDPGWSYNPGERMWVSTKEIAEKEKAVLGAVRAPAVAKIMDVKAQGLNAGLATTLKEAEEFALKNYAENINYTGGMGFGSKFSKVKQLEKLNEVNRAIQELKNAFPQLNIPKIKTVCITSSKRGRASLAPFHDATMAVADNWDNKVWANIKNWEEKNARPWDWYNDETHTAINARHELAHIIDGHLKIQASKEWKDIAKIAWGHASSVSDYAGSKGTELFAELFSQYTSPFYRKHRAFPKEIEVFLDWVLSATF